MLSKKQNTSSFEYVHVHQGIKSSWWLLLSLQGVAVKLGDGVGVSWPGYAISHCSSVPLHRYDFLSLFTTLSKPLEAVFYFQKQCRLVFGKLYSF